MSNLEKEKRIFELEIDTETKKIHCSECGDCESFHTKIIVYKNKQLCIKCANNETEAEEHECQFVSSEEIWSMIDKLICELDKIEEKEGNYMKIKKGLEEIKEFVSCECGKE